MNTVMTVKKGVVLAMALSAMMLSSAHALTVYTAGPGSLAKSLASGFEQQTGVKVTVFQATTGKVMARLEAEPMDVRSIQPLLLQYLQQPVARVIVTHG